LSDERTRVLLRWCRRFVRGYIDIVVSYHSWPVGPSARVRCAESGGEGRCPYRELWFNVRQGGVAGAIGGIVVFQGRIEVWVFWGVGFGLLGVGVCKCSGL
jgi:hypothetical protein